MSDAVPGPTHAAGAPTSSVMSKRRRLIAVGVVALCVTPALLAPATTGLVEGSMGAAVEGAIKAAILFLPALLLAALFLPIAIDPGTRMGRRLRTFGPVLLLVFVQGMWWILSKPPLGGGSREGLARIHASSDLRYLASLQEVHFADHGVYAGSLDDLAFAGYQRSDVRLEAVPTGWTATVEVILDPDVSCAMYAGEGVQPLPTKSGFVPLRPGVLYCEPAPPLLGWGRAGALLRAYYEALERRLA